MLFTKSKLSLKEIKELKFELEKDLQSLTEENLWEIFWLRFISSEFSLNSRRLDTLAFDDENKSFVIIEYKRDRSFSVIDQWYSYLSLMLNNKAEFILEYQEATWKSLNRKEVNWSQSKVLFIANSFTFHQRQAINFKDLPIEIREAKKFSWDIFSYDRIKPLQQSESIKTVSNSEIVSKVNKEVKSYNLSDHIKPDWERSKHLYDEFTSAIWNLDDRLEESITSPYIWYKIWNKVVFDIKPRKTKLVLELLRVKPKDLKDPEKRLKNVDYAMKNYWKFVSQMNISNSDDLQYWVLLIKQLLNKLFS